MFIISIFQWQYLFLSTSQTKKYEKFPLLPQFCSWFGTCPVLPAFQLVSLFSASWTCFSVSFSCQVNFNSRYCFCLVEDNPLPLLSKSRLICLPRTHFSFISQYVGNFARKRFVLYLLDTFLSVILFSLYHIV